MPFTIDQTHAIEVFGKNTLVSAGAGSGKTTVLTKKVLTMMTDPVNPISIDEMLVMTFTTLAAENMKTKIREKLNEDKEKYKKELEKIDSSYICTIDSFCSALVKKYNYALGISKAITVLPTNIERQKKKEIVEELFNDYYLKEEKDFLRIIDAYTFKSDKDLKNLIISLNNGLDKKPDKMDYLCHYFDNCYTDEWFKKYKQDYEELLLRKAKEIRCFADDFLDECTSDCPNNELIEEMIYKIVYAPTIGELNAALNAFAFPRYAAKYKVDEKIWTKAKGNLDKQIKALKDSSTKVLSDDGCLIDPDVIESTKTIVELEKELEKRMMDYKMIHQSFTFNDISKMAITLLKNNIEIREEVKNSFKVIMVDETQDNSDIQDELISFIGNNNVFMVGDVKQSIYRFRNANPKLFKDKYDAYKPYDPASTDKNPVRIDLLENFRSREEVIEDINKIFSLLMSDSIGGANYKKEHLMRFGNTSYNEPGHKDPTQNYKMDIINYQNVIDYLGENNHLSKEEIEAIVIAKDIRKKIENHFKILGHNDKENKDELRDAIYSDFCIITDAKKAFDIYHQIFDYFNIPLKVCKKETLNSGDELKTIVNIMSLIKELKTGNYKKDSYNLKYYYTSIARSFLFRKEDNVIFNLVKSETIDELLKDEIIEKANKIASQLDYLTASEFVQMIANEYHIEERFLDYGVIDKINPEMAYMISAASSISDIGLPIDEVITYFENLKNDEKIKEEYAVSIPDSNAVTLINTHLSKGLEYSVCYFSDLNRGYNIQDTKTLIALDEDYGFIFNKNIADSEATSSDTNPCKELFIDKFIREDISEKIRLFYVALTRAKEKMILVDSFDPDQCKVIDEELMDTMKLKAKSPHDLLMLIYTYFGDRIIDAPLERDLYNDNYKMDQRKKKNLETSLVNKIEVTTLEIGENKEIDNFFDGQIYSKKSHLLVSKEEKSNMEYGEKVHEALELLDFKQDKNELNSEINALDLDQKTKDALINFFNLSIMKDVSKAKIFKEHEFISSENNAIGIIDLLLEYEDKFVIIDYKLKNIDVEAYHKQLEGYAAYIEKNNKSEKNVEAYLVSILGGNMEKII